MTQFAIATNHENPPHNHVIFEEYFCSKFVSNAPKTKREYLPVCWTNYYISKNYCNDSMDDLQNYLDGLDRNKSYFTVCQWDDGIVNNIDGLDLFVFSSGGIGDYAYPLNCMPHPDIQFHPRRDILCSFIGAIEGRHPIREKMQDALSHKDHVFIRERTSFDHFKDSMCRSAFALCPRGYGKTSFRICEALQIGVVPVYIYDDPWIPFSDVLDFENYGVLCHIDDIDGLYDKLYSISSSSHTIDDLINTGKFVYHQYYLYSGCYNNIVKVLQRPV